ncbi:spermidine synthase [Microbacterium sp. gxy059]|uniref:spermidine synthase n=1 Tax=Microbacterium sp. gxy059 TaxID=2957199 RepID=UPI003D95C0D0
MSDARGEAPWIVPLSGGGEAALRPVDGGWLLEVDGVRQSHVPAPGGRPPLAITRWMIAALGRGDAIRALHLGGGILALPRALADARPGSTQLVAEKEPAFVELARTRFPAPDGAEVVEADARRLLAGTEEGAWDAVTIDVFAGGRIPPPFSSIECAAEARRALAPGGLLVVNSVAGPEIDFTRRHLAGLRATFAHVAMIVQGSSLGGLRFGNACLVASDRPLDADGIRGSLREDPSKGALVTDLDDLVGDAAPLHDTDETWSPEPDLPDAANALAALERMRQTLTQLLPPKG